MIEEIFEHGHTIKSWCFDTRKIRTLTPLREEFIQKLKEILFRFCWGWILSASAYYKHLYSRAQLLKKLNTQQSKIHEKSIHSITTKMIVTTSLEYFSILSFRHGTLKRFVAIWATLLRQLWRPERFENRLLFLHWHLSRLKWNFGGKTWEISDCRVCSFYRARAWHKVCIICLILPTHAKKEHKQTTTPPFLSRSAGHDPLREVLILLRAVDHDTLQESLLLFRAATIP